MLCFTVRCRSDEKIDSRSFPDLDISHVWRCRESVLDRSGKYAVHSLCIDFLWCDTVKACCVVVVVGGGVSNSHPIKIYFASLRNCEDEIQIGVSRFLNRGQHACQRIDVAVNFFKREPPRGFDGVAKLLLNNHSIDDMVTGASSWSQKSHRRGLGGRLTSSSHLRSVNSVLAAM